jgi:signal transduction histidine kinase
MAKRLVRQTVEIALFNGVSHEVLLAGENLTPSQLRKDRHGWVSWELLARILRRYREHTGWETFLRHWEAFGKTDSYSTIRGLARWVVSPDYLFTTPNERVIRGAAPLMDIAWRRPRPGFIELDLRVPSPLEPSPEFWHATAIALRQLPCLTGLREAHVEIREEANGATYFIRVPPSRTILARLRHAWRALFLPDTALNALDDHCQDLIESCHRLQSTERDLTHLLDCHPDGGLLHRQEQIVWMNAAMAALLGAPSRVEAIRHPLDPGLRDEAMPATFQYEIARDSSLPRIVEFTRVSGVLWQGEQCSLLVGRDVTDQRRLEREVLEISNREQERLARDIHDGLSQELVVAQWQARQLSQSLPAEAASKAQSLTELLEKIRNNIRSLSHRLDPVSGAGLTLAGALRQLAANCSERYGVACQVKAGDEAAPPSLDTAHHLYRIVQEALNNSLRHGEATEIIIHLDPGLLTVTDNGQGFDPASVNPGMGMRLMRYRAESLGGHLAWRRNPTQLVCRFPTTHAVVT